MRAESLVKSAMFRDALASGRCLIPARLLRRRTHRYCLKTPMPIRSRARGVCVRWLVDTGQTPRSAHRGYRALRSNELMASNSHPMRPSCDAKTSAMADPAVASPKTAASLSAERRKRIPVRRWSTLFKMRPGLIVPVTDTSPQLSLSRR